MVDYDYSWHAVMQCRADNNLLHIVKGAELMKSLARKLVVIMVALVLVATSGVIAFAEEEFLDIVPISAELTAEDEYNLLAISVAMSVKNVGDKFAALADAIAAGKDDAVILAAAVATADAVDEMVALCAEKAEMAYALGCEALGVDVNSSITIEDILASADQAFAVGEGLEEIDPEAAVKSFELAAILYERCALAYDYFEEYEAMNDIVVELGDPDVDWADSFLLRDVESLLYSAAGLYEAADEMLASVKVSVRDAA